MTTKTFPLLGLDIGISTLPFAFVAEFRVKLERNHGQTLERLAERGGLAWCELWAGIEGRNLSMGTLGSEEVAAQNVLMVLSKWVVTKTI
jgi:hypothetical protein